MNCSSIPKIAEWSDRHLREFSFVQGKLPFPSMNRNSYSSRQSWQSNVMKISLSKTETMKVSGALADLNINLNNTELITTSQQIWIPGKYFHRRWETRQRNRKRIQRANSPTLTASKHPNRNKSETSQQHIFTPTLTYQCRTCMDENTGAKNHHLWDEVP